MYRITPDLIFDRIKEANPTLQVERSMVILSESIPHQDPESGYDRQIRITGIEATGASGSVVIEYNLFDLAEIAIMLNGKLNYTLAELTPEGVISELLENHAIALSPDNVDIVVALPEVTITAKPESDVVKGSTVLNTETVFEV